MRARRWLLTLIAFGAAAPAFAVTGSASVTPAALSASLGSTLPTGLLWSVQLTGIGPAAAPGPLVLTSPQATVSSAAGQVLQVVSSALSVHLGATGQGSVAETFTLSPATIASAQRLGIDTLYLRRTFGVKPYGGTATLTIAIGGSAAGPLALSRVALHFDDRSLQRVLRAGESTVAIAEINYTGSGVLSGLWEVASPPTTLGQPVFVPLAGATLNLAGGGMSELTSPPLPDTLAGIYLVRFRVRNPSVPFTGLTLRYAVETDSFTEPPIEVQSPKTHATLKSDTVFAWQPAASAESYRLEFYEADLANLDHPPVSGTWLPGTRRDVVLSALTQSHLQPGQSYHWRVIALDAQGEIIGRSGLYEIRTP
ncbi:MAG TPA: hypothetical protein VKG63_05390 [Steroidobacteraceae bacterium]|nr:hypothetical protein [Steroidobacteraceae bacterium]